ncbi:MAG TPA: C25 family cysteine peptidase [Pyrinomonadaceae bacterium]|nr:C25 family cysteine peptidase [Pyrinomonadaceae bacterium]
MRRVISSVLIVICVSLFGSSAMSQKSKSAGQLQRASQATSAKATSFASAAAYSDGKAVWLAWQMEAEFGNIGFNVYRVGGNGVELLTQVRMVPGAAMHAREVPEYGATYNFYDGSPDGMSSYYVESLSLTGAKVASQQVYPRYVPSLAEFTGLSDEQMQRRGDVLDPTSVENTIPNFTKDIAAEVEEYRQLADASTHRMVISQPNVARIGVKRAGLYRVTRAQLGAALFDVNSDSSLWQLYVEGVQQAIIVGPGASYIEFYGTGTDTAESDTRTYYLIKGATAGKRIENRVAHPAAGTVITPNYFQTYVKKERFNFLDDIFNNDAENYFGRGYNSSPNGAPVTFNLSGIDFNRPNATMELRFQGYSNGSHVVEVTLNGHALAPTNGSNLDNFSGTYSIPTSFLLEGANSIKFRAAGPVADFVFFDTISIGYNRKFLAEQNTLNFYTQSLRIAKLDGFTSPNVRVFDMTHDGNPVLVTNLVFQQIGSTFGTNMPAARGRSFFAVEDSAILTPVTVTANNPDLLSVPANAASLVIISYKDFMTQAEAWADYRRSQGVTVKVVEVSEVYDEFNYGVMSSESIKSFLQYAYQNYLTPPQYVLLVGDASWDPRNYEGEGFYDFVPPKLVTTVYSETASDEYLADFNSDGLTEMAIGRIPARTVTEVNTMFTKTQNWEAALTPTTMSTRGVLFAYDFNDGYNFATMSTRLRNQLPADTPATFVYRGETNANANLLAAMNTGKFMVNYSGHGTPGSWGGNPLFFNVDSVVATTPHSPAVYTMLTCLNGYYHWLYFPSIAETLVNSPNRGAVAAWASSGKTLPNVQEEMATRFYSKVGAGTIPRMGDLVRDAKTALVPPFDSPDVRLSWALLGDPMLKVR